MVALIASVLIASDLIASDLTVIEKKNKNAHKWLNTKNN